MMQFHEKLQTLRKQRGLTQEELAGQLYVSRTAISKWESGRGYPSIDSLKAISGFFSVSIDELLSADALLTCAQAEQRQTRTRFRDQVFGLLDCACGLMLFLPFFGQSSGEAVQAVSLLSMTRTSLWLKAAVCSLIAAAVLWGIGLLALQSWEQPLWTKGKRAVSLVLSIGLVLLFLLSRQPYAAAFAFVLLGVKVFFLLKNR